MTDEEIYLSYRDSINKLKQIKILAQLNLCTTADIECALNRYKIRLKEIESYRNEWDRYEATIKKSKKKSNSK